MDFTEYMCQTYMYFHVQPTCTFFFFSTYKHNLYNFMGFLAIMAISFCQASVNHMYLLALMRCLNYASVRQPFLKQLYKEAKAMYYPVQKHSSEE